MNYLYVADPVGKSQNARIQRPLWYKCITKMAVWWPIVMRRTLSAPKHRTRDPQGRLKQKKIQKISISLGVGGLDQVLGGQSFLFHENYIYIYLYEFEHYLWIFYHNYLLIPLSGFEVPGLGILFLTFFLSFSNLIFWWEKTIAPEPYCSKFRIAFLNSLSHWTRFF